MSLNKTPLVLLVDDNPEPSSLSVNLEAQGVELRSSNPDNLTLYDLEDADLVLVDYNLDDWHPDVPQELVSCQPPDGLALASVLRRHVRDFDRASPTAFALYTGIMDKLAFPLPREHREHVLARLNGLEWVFPKEGSKGGVQVDLQIALLAKAMRSLPKKWPSEGDSSLDLLLTSLLCEDVTPDTSPSLVRDVLSCSPPIHELSSWSNGLAILRWILQRILPYPTFLWEKHYLAARLRIDVTDIVAELVEGRPLFHALEGCTYKGILAGFLGPRWWRTKIESWLWEATSYNSSNPLAVWNAVCKAADKELSRSSPTDFPLVCLNTPLCQCN